MMTTYCYTVGDITVTVLHAGGNDAIPIEQFVGRFPGVELDAFKQARADIGRSTEVTETSLNPFLIETDGQRILMDTGLGGEEDAVVAALAEIGVSPADIDVVFISHLHPDHFNGLLKADGTLTYPNATLKIAELEWNAWLTDEALEEIAKRDENLANGLKAKVVPATEQMTVEKLQSGDVLAPGVTIFDAVGHTPGHSGLMIESNGEKLFCTVDAAHQLVQMANIDWSIVFDTYPEVSPKTRERLFTRAAEEDLVVLTYHFPFPGLGKITKLEKGFRWEPLDTSE